MNFELGIVGISIKQNNIALLERLTLDVDTRAQQLSEIKQKLNLDELIYLSTCNRVEFIYTTSHRVSPDFVRNRLLDFFFSGGRDIDFGPNDFIELEGAAAVNHLFRVVASLESLVIGETQIADQFRKAYQEAMTSGLAGATLSQLANEAFLVAKKVRAQTGLGEGSLSMASLAAAHVKKLIPRKDNALIALVGAGEMTIKMARYITDQNLGRILFVNRTVDKARLLVERFGGAAISLEEFLRSPGPVDAIVSSTASSDVIFGKSFLRRIEAAGRNILCIDLAIPRDFGAEFGLCPFVKLIGIAHLQTHSEENLRKKFREVSRANEIVNETVRDYLRSNLEKSIKPIFQDSYKESISLARQAFDDLFNKTVTGIESEDKERILHLVEKLIGHSAFQPSKKLSEHLVKIQSDVHLPLSSDTLNKRIL